VPPGEVPRHAPGARCSRSQRRFSRIDGLATEDASPKSSLRQSSLRRAACGLLRRRCHLAQHSSDAKGPVLAASRSVPGRPGEGNRDRRHRSAWRHHASDTTAVGTSSAGNTASRICEMPPSKQADAARDNRALPDLGKPNHCEPTSTPRSYVGNMGALITQQPLNATGAESAFCAFRQPVRPRVAAGMS